MKMIMEGNISHLVDMFTPGWRCHGQLCRSGGEGQHPPLTGFVVCSASAPESVAG